MFNNYNKFLSAQDHNMAASSYTRTSARFDTHFNKMLSEHLQSSACFLIQFEDGTEMLICLSQTALVRDLYSEIDNRLTDTPSPKGLYVDQAQKHYITSCNETLQSLVTHFNLTPSSPPDYGFPVFTLYISLAQQQKTSSQKFKQSYASTGTGTSNLTINGRAMPQHFGFH